MHACAPGDPNDGILHTQAHPGVHAYFKSTDGHHGNWSFNLRRPNLHLLPVTTAHGGYEHFQLVALPFFFGEPGALLQYRIILVDSTRAGKRLPDALSKTVPIWCAVVNRALRLRLRGAPDVVSDGARTPWLESGDLHTPPGIVGAHEHAQIAARIDEWAAGLAVRVFVTQQV